MINREEIIKLLTDILLENIPLEEINGINDDDDLLLKGLDSMGAVKLMVSIEDTYGFEIPEEDIEITNFSSLRKISDYIEKHVGISTTEVPDDASLKIAVVTGANRGIGKGIAKTLKDDGYHVISVSRSSSGEEWLEEVLCDLTNVDEINNAIDYLTHKYHHINVLINNAGSRYFERVDRISIEEWEKAIAVNITAPLLLQKGLIKQLVRGNGYVFYIGSSAAENYFEGGTSYSSTKLALKGLCESSIIDLRYEGIRFSYLQVGATTIENYEEDWKISPEDIGKLVLNTYNLPLGVMLPFIDIRPSKPLRPSITGLNRLQYI